MKSSKTLTLDEDSINPEDLSMGTLKRELNLQKKTANGIEQIDEYAGNPKTAKRNGLVSCLE